ncbi:MAG: hypothetical protein KA998_03845, partial [Rickettsiaceae bacterium]|nr:hypothetical protein [Rickettsiaceae bacterium]
ITGAASDVATSALNQGAEVANGAVTKLVAEASEEVAQVAGRIGSTVVSPITEAKGDPAAIQTPSKQLEGKQEEQSKA